jgi:hypothetical protein
MRNGGRAEATGSLTGVINYFVPVPELFVLRPACYLSEVKVYQEI